MTASGRFTRYIPTLDEQGSYTGPFSTFAEYHSFAMGFGAAATCSTVIMSAIAAYAVLQGTRRHRRSGHWRDLAKEPAYALGALAFGRGLFCTSVIPM